MKVIHIKKSTAAYQIFITEASESAAGSAQSAQTIGEVQLEKLLTSMGASEKGIANVFKQLTVSDTAQLQL